MHLVNQNNKYKTISKVEPVKFGINLVLAISLVSAASTNLILSSTNAQAQMPADGGQVDIQAQEQEFSGEQVIARGNVRVKFKDTIINAPLATLYKSPEGKPQKAVFTGHPYLQQDKSKIDADVLTFDMNTQHIVAEGRSHSEVESEARAEESNDKAGNKKLAMSSATSGSSVEKIITDADKQEYDQATGKFDASGHVKVKHGDVVVIADKLQLLYGENKKPETCLFTGHVVATQNQNSTAADNIAYSLVTKRIQATGNVRSKVIQDKDKKGDAGKTSPSTNKTASAGQNGANPISGAFLPTANASARNKKSGEKMTVLEIKPSSDPIFIVSDSQDYSEGNGRMTASGNVRIYYQDLVGMGPKVILLRTETGEAEKVFFVGRSQVSQPGKRWIADRITVIVAEKRVLAEGNTKAVILQKPAAKPAFPYPQQDYKFASKPGSQISQSKPGVPVQ